MSSSTCRLRNARALALWSALRRSRWRANSSRALAIAVSMRRRLAPRCGRRMRTVEPRNRPSTSSHSSRSSGCSETSTVDGGTSLS